MKLKCASCQERFLKLHPTAGICFACYQMMKRTIANNPEDYI
jgi:hypothetical protein